MIDAHSLSKSFGEVQAVRDVSLTAPDGRITGLLGPNGAGKTTTLRMISTVLRPDSGRVSVDGHDPLSDPMAVQRAIGALPESHGLYPRLTARENVRYFGRLHGVAEDVLEERIEWLTDLLDMGSIVDRKSDGFSHGERVKVALARALVHDPHNVILDEPTVGLDVMSTRAVRQFVRALREDGRAVLLSSHIMQEVSHLCDEIVIVARGVVVARGTPQALRESTGEESLEDAFVAVIGSTEGLE
jgi:sodium transport system ATP-binding protein